MAADFRTLLVEKERAPDESFRLFSGFYVGGWWLSIQAGPTQWCRPRVLLDDVTRYEAWEVGIGNPGWDVDVHTDPQLKNFAWTEYFLRFNGGPVPTEVVQQIVDDLERTPLEKAAAVTASAADGEGSQ